ncbi:MAG: CC0125/CC1285 family lipoprotein [Alphaproteobacteria bacterium]
MNLRTIAIAALSLSLVACVAQPTPYQARAEGTGYTEQQLDSQTWRVEFAGNTVTPRETVENYLLYRAAEIMLFGGYDKFVVLEKEIEKNVTYQGSGVYRPHIGVGFSRHRHFGYGYYGSYAPDRYYPRVNYTGYMTIRTLKGAPVPSDAVVYDAQELVQQLGPTIRLPQPAEG